VAAVREVKEETGIETEFDSIVAFRHWHKANFGCSDVYIVCHLRPVSSDVTICQREIKDCKWMPIKEYLEHQDVHNLNKWWVRKYQECKAKGVAVKMEEMELQFKQFRFKRQMMFSPNFDDAINKSP